MTKNRFISYRRVSTERQGRSGLGLEAQREAVARYIAQTGGELVEEFQEVESGKRNDRPQLAAALTARGVATPSGGGRWHPATVSRMLGYAIASEPRAPQA
jgi:hypothetical protein